jgi:hypothetical protein
MLRTDEVAVVEPARTRFFSFRYSFTEVSLVGGRTRVKSRQARFEDGKLTSEAFEGELDHTTYDQMVSQAQQHFLGVLARFLPFRD